VKAWTILTITYFNCETNFQCKLSFLFQHILSKSSISFISKSNCVGLYLFQISQFFYFAEGLVVCGVYHFDSFTDTECFLYLQHKSQVTHLSKLRQNTWHNPFGRTMALGSTQPLTEMSTRNISCGRGGGKGGRCLGLTTLPPSCADCLEIWEPQPSGNLRACPGIALPYVLHQNTILPRAMLDCYNVVVTEAYTVS
jgi:hypothetical protein